MQCTSLEVAEHLIEWPLFPPLTRTTAFAPTFSRARIEEDPRLPAIFAMFPKPPRTLACAGFWGPAVLLDGAFLALVSLTKVRET